MSVYAKAKELRQKRAKVCADAAAVLETANKRDGKTTGEEEQRIGALYAEAGDFSAGERQATGLAKQIEQYEAQMDKEQPGSRSLLTLDGRESPPAQGQPGEAALTARGTDGASERRHLDRGVLHDLVNQEMRGIKLLNPDAETMTLHRMVARESLRNFLNGVPVGDMSEDARALVMPTDEEVRALSDVTGAAGAYTVPQGFWPELDTALKAYGGILRACDTMPTDSGADLPFPTANDTANMGELLTEGNAAAEDTDPTFGQVLFKAWIGSSKVILIPVSLLQDSAFNMEAWLNDALGMRLGRLINYYCTVGTGTGNNQPAGLVPGATVGVTTASPTAIVYNELVDLEHSVDPAYRSMPGCGWMAPDSTVALLKKLVDGQSRPLWQPGLAVGQPDKLMGYPYTVNTDMDAPAATKKSLMFGDLKRYKVRMVRSVQMVRFVERYMNKLQAGLPVKVLQMHA
jgi:HK97 family phage major capsid protein